MKTKIGLAAIWLVLGLGGCADDAPEESPAGTEGGSAVTASEAESMRQRMDRLEQRLEEQEAEPEATERSAAPPQDGAAGSKLIRQ